MTRRDFTGSARTFAELAAVYPDLDHFHAVELWVDSSGGTRKKIYNLDIHRGGGMITVSDETEDVSDVRISEFASVFGDVWHDREVA